MQLLTIWAALTISGGTATLDVGGSIAVRTYLPAGPAWSLEGITLGPLVLIDPRAPDQPGIIRHELEHVTQWEALGPAFPLAYLLAPTEFEDYLPGGETWIPPPDSNLPKCPVLRLTSNTVSLFPCWRFP